MEQRPKVFRALAPSLRKNSRFHLSCLTCPSTPCTAWHAGPDAPRQQNANPEGRCHFCSCLWRVLPAARAGWRPSGGRPASATMSDSGRPMRAMSLRFASRPCESCEHGTGVVAHHETERSDDGAPSAVADGHTASYAPDFCRPPNLSGRCSSLWERAAGCTTNPTKLG